MMIITHSIDELKAALKNMDEVALVPTMGYLHEGHLTLINAARQSKKPVVASIFVNPLQFGPNEDFERYPRSFEADCEKLKKAGVSVVFAPTPDVLYPQPQTCFVDPTSQHDLLEEKSRPGHLTGVATIVMKLFHLICPSIAFFGKKDYQQLSMIRNMVMELNMDIEIIGIDTVREKDGLAMSSRNAYLTEEERKEAPFLYYTLQGIRQCILERNDKYAALIENATNQLTQRRWKVDYIAIRPQNQLQSEPSTSEALVILAAARLGNTRLIDNIEVNV